MRGAVLHIARAERRAEEVAGEAFQHRLDAGILRDCRIVDPGRGVERTETPRAMFDLERAEMAGLEIDCERDPFRADCLKSLAHDLVRFVPLLDDPVLSAGRCGLTRPERSGRRRFG